MEGEAETTPTPAARAPSPDESKIVVKLARKRSDGQKESLARAQASRREKIAARKEAKADMKEVVAATKADVVGPDAEPAKDYRLLYKIQKQSLAELMFEKRVNDKLIESLKEKRESAESARAPTAVDPPPAVSAVPASDAGWRIGMTPVKKNIMRHW